MNGITSLSLGEGSNSLPFQLPSTLRRSVMSNATLKLANLIAGANNAVGAAPDAKKPAAKLYLNVGYNHPTLGRINLPFNLSLDHMQLRDMNGTDEWKLKSALSNNLLETLRDAVSQLGQGESALLEGLTVEAYHRKDSNTAAPADDLAAAMAAIPAFSMKRTAP